MENRAILKLSWCIYYKQVHLYLIMVIAVNMNFVKRNVHKNYVPFMFDLFSEFAAKNKEHKFYFIVHYLQKKNSTISDNVHIVETKTELKNILAIQYWYNIKLPLILKKISATLLINTDGICSSISTLNQVLYLPEGIMIDNKKVENYIHKAKKIFSFSLTQKNILIEKYAIASGKVHTITFAANNLFEPQHWGQNQIIKDKYTQGKEYFYCRINVHPSNNIVHVLKAFSIFKKWQKSNMKLVIVGDLFWDKNKWNKIIETYKYKDEVITINGLEIDEVAKLTAASYCAIYINNNADIALPIIEAMQSAVPIIACKNGNIEELGSNAIIYVDPLNIEDIAGQMQNIYKNENLRNKQIELGKGQIKQNSWEKSLKDLSQLIVL